jgi:hypothetical protein
VGEVIEFPLKKSCEDCEWAAFSSRGIHCLQLREDIWDPAWAVECDLFDPITITRSAK